MNTTKKQLSTLDKYNELQRIGIKAPFIAKTLNERGLKRKTQSPYVPQTVIYTANEYQKDANIVSIIDEMHGQYCSKNTLQNA